MFSVLFEVQPHRDEWDAYLANAKMLRTNLEQAPGFVDHIHYSSLTQDGWMLSLSGWLDEEAAVGWHTRMRHPGAQDTGRSQILPDYRLRLGEVTSDTRGAEGQKIAEQREDETQAGESNYVTLIDAKQTLEWVTANNPEEIALYLGFDFNSYGDCISWDVFDALLSPGEIMLMVTWRDAQSANGHAATQIVPDDARVRVVRVIRDSTMFEGRETAQHYPDAAGREMIRA